MRIQNLVEHLKPNSHFCNIQQKSLRMFLHKYLGYTCKSILERKTSLRRFWVRNLVCDVLKFVFLHQFSHHQVFQKEKNPMQIKHKLSAIIKRILTFVHLFVILETNACEPLT